MIKDKTLYDLQNLVRKLVSDKNSIDDVRSFLLQLIFCFYCEESGIFLGKPFTQLVLNSEACLFRQDLCSLSPPCRPSWLNHNNFFFRMILTTL